MLNIAANNLKDAKRDLEDKQNKRRDVEGERDNRKKDWEVKKKTATKMPTIGS